VLNNNIMKNIIVIVKKQKELDIPSKGTLGGSVPLLRIGRINNPKIKS